MEAIREQKTISQIAKEFQVHPVQVCEWKKQLLDGCGFVFDSKNKQESKDDEVAELERKIGRLCIENDFLKKTRCISTEEKKKLIEPEHATLSVRAQCSMPGLCRASYYYQTEETDRRIDFELMRLIDQEYLVHPFYGSRRMTEVLKIQGYCINRKKGAKIDARDGARSNLPEKNLSQAGNTEIKFPYLMKSLKIDRPKKAWCADITYIPLKDGFGYCVAVMDWWSRCVLAWRVSNSMDISFCLEALEEALSKGKSEVFNTDQGSQFTSSTFVEILLKEHVRVNWDGKGRALDNVFIERLWRSLKPEDVYLKDYVGLSEAREGITRYFDFYNQKRPHQALKNQTPSFMYYGKSDKD